DAGRAVENPECAIAGSLAALRSAAATTAVVARRHAVASAGAIALSARSGVRAAAGLQFRAQRVSVDRALFAAALANPIDGLAHRVTTVFVAQVAQIGRPAVLILAAPVSVATATPATP